MKMNCRCLSLGQREGYRFCCLFEPLQVPLCSPEVNAAEYPATLLESAAIFFPPTRLDHLIKLHPGEGDEKVGKKSLCVLLAQDFRLSTENHYYGYPHIFQDLGITITAGGITMDHQRMNFPA